MYVLSTDLHEFMEKPVANKKLKLMNECLKVKSYYASICLSESAL